MLKRELLRQKRHTALRSKIFGTTERPRLSIYRGLQGLHVQIIDDSQGKTIVSGMSHKKKIGDGTGIERARSLAKTVSQQAKDKKITKMVFDRGGFHYHGQVKAFAEAVREEGITL